MTKRMGFEGKAYYGTAGSTGATELTNSRDISFKLATEKGDTTVRGSSGVPKKTSRVTQLSADDIEIVMLNDNSDTALEAMRCRGCRYCRCHSPQGLRCRQGL